MMISSGPASSSLVLLSVFLSASFVHVCDAQFEFLTQFFGTSSQPMNNLFAVKSSLTRKINNPATHKTTVKLMCHVNF